jgi:hypothetical protein
MSKTEMLVSNLNVVSDIIRNGGDVSSDYFDSAEQFATSIDQLSSAVLESSKTPFKFMYALFLRKKAKYTWASPSFDLDDYLAGHPAALMLGNEIYDLL